jgi:hypothetical protein
LIYLNSVAGKFLLVPAISFSKGNASNLGESGLCTASDHQIALGWYRSRIAALPNAAPQHEFDGRQIHHMIKSPIF